MKKRLYFQLQILFGLILGLMLGYLYQLLGVNAIPPRPVVASTPIPQTELSFKTLNEGWVVKVMFNRQSEPKIESVKRQVNVRISDPSSGDYEIKLVGPYENVLYNRHFHVSFIITGLSKQRDNAEMLFVLPVVENEKKIVVISPQGKVEYELPSQ